MLDPETIDAVVFDIGGVFLIPHPDPLGAALDEAGVAVDVADHDAFHLAHHRGVRAITDLVYAEGVSPDEGRAEVWRAYDAAYFPAVGVSDQHLETAITVRQEMRNHGVMGIWEFPLVDNIAASAQIAGTRPIAVVSNNDGTADQQMVNHGVGQVGSGPLPELLALVDSGVVGVAKPDPAIFDGALHALGMAPERVLYVGDTVHADVVGAEAAGLQVVQLDPHDLHTDFDHERLPSLVQLADLLA